MKEYKYQEVYQSIINDIEQGYLKYHDKIPSIRNMAKSLNVSCTTVESAYFKLLIEGYIYSKEKVGYFIDVEYPQVNNSLQGDNREIEIDNYQYLYDFSGKRVDHESFNFDIWKKYIKKTLANNEALMCYGDIYGEERLKNALQKYSKEYRGVKRSKNNYIIGAGFQTMLYHLCGLFPKDTIIAIEENGFKQAETVFEDFYMNVRKIPVNQDGIILEEVKNSGAKLLYINSSSGGYHGHPIKQRKRMEIIKFAIENDIYIIEDDHNGELKFNTKPIDAMAKDNDTNIIYIGSFSKLLLPSIRISYMVIPNTLIKQYINKFKYHHQTASKLEQLALASYIEDGQLARHLKRLRKHYYIKGNYMLKILKEYFPHHHFELYETSLKITISLDQNKINEYIDLAKENNILVNKNNNNEIALSFSGILQKDMDSAIKVLSKIWK